MQSDYYQPKISSKRNNSEIRSYSFFQQIRSYKTTLYESRSCKRYLPITILFDGGIENLIVAELGIQNK